MAAVNILSVCGSGTVTSSMVAAKLKEKLGERGYSVSATEARPTEALNLATSGRFDILTHTSPLPDGDYTSQSFRMYYRNGRRPVLRRCRSGIKIRRKIKVF